MNGVMDGDVIYCCRDVVCNVSVYYVCYFCVDLESCYV